VGATYRLLSNDGKNLVGGVHELRNLDCEIIALIVSDNRCSEFRTGWKE